MEREIVELTGACAGRGIGIAMIAGGIGVMAVALIFFPGITRWFEYITAAAVVLVAISLVGRGLVMTVRKVDSPD